MCRRIIVVAFLLLSFMCLSVNGQTAIVYSYDSAGNRTSRTTVEATDVASVLSVMPIDAYGRLNSSPAVSNILCNIASLTSGEVDEKVGISRTDSGDMAENTSRLWHFDFIEIGAPSIVGSISDDIGLSDHHREWYEVWSNQMSYNYFDRHNETAITSNWSTNNPRKQHVDWFFYTTMVYYASLFRWPFIFIF